MFPPVTSKLFGNITWCDVTLYFLLAVSGSNDDKFGFANLRGYSSKSEFYDVFTRDNCPSLILKEFPFVYV